MNGITMWPPNYLKITLHELKLLGPYLPESRIFSEGYSSDNPSSAYPKKDMEHKFEVGKEYKGLLFLYDEMEDHLIEVKTVYFICSEINCAGSYPVVKLFRSNQSYAYYLCRYNCDPLSSEVAWTSDRIIYAKDVV